MGLALPARSWAGAGVEGPQAQPPGLVTPAVVQPRPGGFGVGGAVKSRRSPQE